MPHLLPSFTRSFSSNSAQHEPPLSPTVPAPRTPAMTAPMHIKRVTLTSKKNWWMVEMDEEEENINNGISHSYTSSEDTAVSPLHHFHHRDYQIDHPQVQEVPTPPPSPAIYRPSRNPTSIFSFPTPTAYCAPPNPTADLTPFAQGSASELFKCVVKKPDVIQLEINGEMQTNASDVTVQFLAELRVYTTLPRHRNIATFLGCLENVGMVLEFVEGRTMYDVIRERPCLTPAQKIDYHNQLLDGLTHLHSFGLSHGDLSLLNVQVTSPSNTVKLLDFGRSVSADSNYTSPEDEPVDPFDDLTRRYHSDTTPKLWTPQRVEQIHPGTRPFSAPEVLRGECQDARLADAYSFGMILVCLDRGELVDCKPWEQRKDLLPKDLFDGCEVFEERARLYLKRWDMRRRLMKEDMIMVKSPF